MNQPATADVQSTEVEKYWGLREAAFQNTPDPRFYFASRGHDEALSRMLYGIRRRQGALLVTGDVGTGKTLLSRSLITRLPAATEIGLITHPTCGPTQLLGDILYELGGEGNIRDKRVILRKLHDRLFQNLSEGKETILIIDEAQAIHSRAVWNEVRMLLNFQRNDRFLLTLLLLGQSETRAKIREVPALRGRLASTFEIPRLQSDEISQYVRFRLQAAGAREVIFTEEAVEHLGPITHGLPRRINTVADQALLLGMLRGMTRVDATIASGVAEEIRREDAITDSAARHL